MVLWTILFCSFFMSVFEIPYRGHGDNESRDSTILGFWSSAWLTIITITSVGYGDFYPHSFLGKILGIIMAVGGAFIVSFLVSVVRLIFSLSNQEKKTYDKILLDRSAAMSIMYALKFYHAKKSIDFDNIRTTGLSRSIIET